MSAPRTQLSRSALVALVVGSMIGAGIFTLPAAFARSTGVVGAIVAWCIAGSGMLMLAFVFQTLSRRQPELDAGIYAYAKAGFGNYMGFTAAFGYWVACCLAQVALLVLIKAALGQFFPAFGDGTTLVAIAAGMLYAGGAKFLLLSALLYAPGTWLYFYARREQKERIFTHVEWLLFSILSVAAIAALIALLSGELTI